VRQGDVCDLPSGADRRRPDHAARSLEGRNEVLGDPVRAGVTSMSRRPRQLGTGMFAFVYAIWLLLFLLVIFTHLAGGPGVKTIW
jgi:hypothetical protein